MRRLIFILLLIYSLPVGCKGKIEQDSCVSDKERLDYESRLIVDSVSNSPFISLTLTQSKSNEFSCDSVEWEVKLVYYYNKLFISKIIETFPSDIALDNIKQWAWQRSSNTNIGRVMLVLGFNGKVFIYSTKPEGNMWLFYNFLSEINEGGTIKVSENMMPDRYRVINYLPKDYDLSCSSLKIPITSMGLCNWLRREGINAKDMTLDDVRRWLDTPSDSLWNVK